MKTILWWGRFDPDYSRNRVVRQAFTRLGFSSREFHPRLSALGDWEAVLRGLAAPDLVWVPCFRQRDMAAALRWCKRHNVPLVFDPLISSYDKRVFERQKIPANSWRARRLQRQETRIFCAADRVVADTSEHARFFHDALAVSNERLHVVPVGAEEELFFPAQHERPTEGPLEILFFGSFLSLHGPQVIVEAARRYVGPPVQWRLLGDGPLRPTCETAAAGLANLAFEQRLDYQQLPGRIRRADILLGIFGASAKAGRVIPNKVFQALACGKPLITRHAPSYPQDVQKSPASGIIWVAPDDPMALAQAVAKLAAEPANLQRMGEAARQTYEQHFSQCAVQQCVARVLSSFGLDSKSS